MSEPKPEFKPGPPTGAAIWYTDFLNKLTRVKVDKVDKNFLITNNIVSEGNANNVIRGLKFLNLINEDGSATDKIKSLDIVGPDYQKNFEIIVHEAYATLFEQIKQIDQSHFEDLLNCFKVEYGMAPSTAGQAVKIFITLAQRAGIKLSDQILENIITDAEKKKPKQEAGKIPFKRKNKKIVDEGEEQLPETVLARLTLKDTGYVDIKNRDDLEIAEAYWKVLQKKLATT